MTEPSDLETLEELAEVETQKTKNKKPILKVVIKKPSVDEESASDEEVEPIKKKKVRTAAQIAAFEKCLDIKKTNAAKRLADAKKLAAFEKAALEEKVVSKALSIKKKQIKKQAALDELSDDDTPIEAVKAKAAKTVPKVGFTFF